MTDRELLELAAKAAGIELDWDVPPRSPPWRITGEGEDRGPAAPWEPLTDDGDALRLAVKLGIEVKYDRRSEVYATYEGGEWEYPEEDAEHNGDRFAAARRAIVRAAAEIGKGMA